MTEILCDRLEAFGSLFVASSPLTLVLVSVAALSVASVIDSVVAAAAVVAVSVAVVDVEGVSEMALLLPSPKVSPEAIVVPSGDQDDSEGGERKTTMNKEKGK